MDSFITSVGSFLPGVRVSNSQLSQYMGELDDERSVRSLILRANGIKGRHYALDSMQKPTHDLYGMGGAAIRACLEKNEPIDGISYLSAGSTNTPLVGPGLATLLHGQYSHLAALSRSVEINSNAGICSAGAQAIVNASRAVSSGAHALALSVGVEQPSDILKSSVIRPVDDREQYEDVRQSKWFMSVFLRSMLSDGAGAFLISREPRASGLSLKIDWSFSRSFAHEAPLCMQLENRSLLLSQDISVLDQYMEPCVRSFIEEGFAFNRERLDDYDVILPHLSSFYFKRHMLKAFDEFSHSEQSAPGYWTNLKTVGNTGSASIYIMLDGYLRDHTIVDGQRLLLFIPESGQFNFVMLSLTAVVH